MIPPPQKGDVFSRMRIRLLHRGGKSNAMVFCSKGEKALGRLREHVFEIRC